MKLTKALKLKNKLVKRANDAYAKLKEFNSVVQGTEIPYPASDSMKEWKDATNELIKLKAKIHVANAPIYEKIYRMSELKAFVTKMKQVDTKHGSVTETPRFGGESKTIEYVAVFQRREVDEFIDIYESEIEALQEEIEQFNATTSIAD